MNRSENMRRIRSKDTNPELLIRSYIFKKGFRYRLHHEDLPGKPDLVFPKKHKIIFIHGCFWHQHKNCVEAHIPKSNRQYWRPKLYSNKLRDSKNLSKLKQLGWSVLIIWECETVRLEKIGRKIEKFLIT